ncbi:hypothetical protein D7I39_16360 [Allopusillimonas ginsengisoli]|nr:hypothetical protein D7I39_16360 [Allopusillimonas ginsengisoli]
MWPSRACSWLHQVCPPISTASERGRCMPQCSHRTMASAVSPTLGVPDALPRPAGGARLTLSGLLLFS